MNIRSCIATALLLSTTLLVLSACSDDDSVVDASRPSEPDAGRDAGADAAPEDAGDEDAGTDASVLEGDGAFEIETTVLAPLAGPLQTRAAGQEELRFFGTDLGATFLHQGQLRILFGDTSTAMARNLALFDDSYGTLAFDQCPAGDEVEAFVNASASEGDPWWQHAGPELELASVDDNDLNLDYLTVFLGDALQTLGPLQVPTSAFTDGEHAFALFNRSEFVECSEDDRGDCPDDFECATDLGTCTGLPFELPCKMGATTPETGECPEDALCVEMGGYCRDPMNHSLDDGEIAGRISTVVQRLLLGVESPDQRGEFRGTPWVTSKLMNSTARVVRDFSTDRIRGAGNDYRIPEGAAGEQAKVLIWGRGNYIGSKAHHREAQVYLALADMPELDTGGAPTWSPTYFAGMNDDGTPRFVAEQSRAVALDLSGGQGDPHESLDVINQMSVTFVAPLQRWVMLYGGDLDPGGREFYNPGASRNEDGAIVIRFAEQPWGPWSAPQALLRAGDTEHPNNAGSQYAAGGLLYHPDCEGDCVPGDSMLVISDERLEKYGWLYGPNVIDCWTEDRGADGVDLYWNVSTWNPYQVVLMKSRIKANE